MWERHWNRMSWLDLTRCYSSRTNRMIYSDSNTSRYLICYKDGYIYIYILYVSACVCGFACLWHPIWACVIETVVTADELVATSSIRSTHKSQKLQRRTIWLPAVSCISVTLSGIYKGRLPASTDTCCTAVSRVMLRIFAYPDSMIESPTQMS